MHVKEREREIAFTIQIEREGTKERKKERKKERTKERKKECSLEERTEKINVKWGNRKRQTMM